MFAVQRIFHWKNIYASIFLSIRYITELPFYFSACRFPKSLASFLPRRRKQKKDTVRIVRDGNHKKGKNRKTLKEYRIAGEGGDGSV